MECYITPFENKPYDQRPYSTNDVCPWCKSTIRLFTLSGNSQYNIYISNGGGNYQSVFSTTDTSFGGRKRITVKNNLLDINGVVYTCDGRGYAVSNVTSFHLWGPFDNPIYTPITIYEVTVQKGDTIYAHLVPVRDESTGHPNFFDEVSGRVMNPELGPTWTSWNEFEIIDGVVIGGRMYPTVTIGNQVWLAENLDYKFDGCDIGAAGIPSTPAAWYYDNDEATYGVNGNRYGLLYNQYAVDYLNQHLSELGIPSGWHVPSSTEWQTLISQSGGVASLTIPMGGIYVPARSSFEDLGNYARQQTSTLYNAGNTYIAEIYSNNSATVQIGSLPTGRSLRLVKDAT